MLPFFEQRRCLAPRIGSVTHGTHFRDTQSDHIDNLHVRGDAHEHHGNLPFRQLQARAFTGTTHSTFEALEFSKTGSYGQRFSQMEGDPHNSTMTTFDAAEY